MCTIICLLWKRSKKSNQKLIKLNQLNMVISTTFYLQCVCGGVFLVVFLNQYQICSQHSYLLFKTCSLKHIPMGEFCSFIANAELCCFCVPSDVKVAIILIDRAYSHNVSRHVHNDVTPTQTLQWKNNYLILIHLHEPNI